MLLFRGFSTQIRPTGVGAMSPTSPPPQPPVAPQPQPPSSLELSRPLFTAVWVLVVVVSSLNALLATIFAAIYYGAMVVRDGYMLESVGLMPAEDVPPIIACYAALALVFWTSALQVILVSIRARRLVFLAPRKSPKQHPTTSKTPPTCWQRKRRQWTCNIPNMFETVFLLRELVEVSTQSYQAYKSSKLIAQPWINHFYVAILALNCWIAPVIHVRTRHNAALQRFLYLCSDVTLDFAATFVIPMCIIVSGVLPAFTANLSMVSGDMTLAYDVPLDDVPFLNLVKGVQQVFVVTWFDFFTKMLPFLSMANCLSQIRHLVRPPSPPPLPSSLALPASSPRRGTKTTSRRSIQAVANLPSRVPQPKTIQVESKSQPTGSLAVVPPDAITAVVVVVTSRSTRHWPRRLRSAVLSTHTIHALLAVWGVCVVAIHTQAWLVDSRMSASSILGCKSSSHPWFVDQVSCTILEINCHRHGFTGQASEIATALSRVDALGVSSLILSHCPQLHVPPQIHTLTNLMWFEIYNATLYEWSDSAALTEAKLPALQYLNVLYVNMTEFPLGLQSSSFPIRLRDISVTATNLTTFPSDLHTKWKRLLNLYVERNWIQELPTTIAEMHPERLSLLGNRISNIPDDMFSESTTLAVFSVARNPITKLPASIGNLEELYLVLIDYTEIQELPTWLTEEGQRRAVDNTLSITVSAGGSPYCRDAIRTGTPLSLPGLLVVCREKAEQEIEASPLTFFRPIRVP